MPSKKIKPLVSVVMPAFNAEKNINEAIESILKQTFKKFELIIVNDASTDKTLQTIRSYARKDSRIKIVNNIKTLNIAKSLNKGIGQAKSNIIARMDADDIALPKRLELQYKLIDSSQKVAVVGANIALINTSGEKIATRNYPKHSKELKGRLFRYSPFAHPVVMFKKDAFLEVGQYNPKYSPTEDLDLWFRIGSRYEFKSIPKILLNYRLDEKSASHSIIRDLEILVFKIRIAAILKHGYRPSMYDVVYNILQFITLWFTPVKYRIKIYNLLRNNDLI